MITPQQNQQAWKYILAIRNGEKKAYAKKFIDHIRYGTPIRHEDYKCGFMAKQAVQISLNEILRGGSL